MRSSIPMSKYIPELFGGCREVCFKRVDAQVFTFLSVTCKDNYELVDAVVVEFGDINTKV